MSSWFVFLAIASFCLHCCAFPFQKRDFSNGPVIAENFPDPAFIEESGAFYAFATTNGKRNVPVASSPNFKDWKVTEHDALPNLPAWGTAPVWAPDVIQRPDGLFVLYFTALSKADRNRHCIGAATSTSATGPYRPLDQPIACPLAQGGAIDSAGFMDVDGSYYVVYKVDANSLGGGGACGNGNLAHDTPIMLQRLDGSGVAPIGDPVPILHRSQYDGPLIEAPSLARTADGFYVVFFSSNCFNGPYYDVSYATARNVAGPYTKSSKPLLLSGGDGGRLNSPGGADVGSEGKRLVFHSDLRPGDAGVRQMWTADIEIRGGVVSIAPAISTVEVS